MNVDHHDLQHEFPGYLEAIHTLKAMLRADGA